MPWSSQNGGGGSGGPWGGGGSGGGNGGGGGPWGGGGNNGGGGPWGQGPRGPQGRGPTPPDLEDIIRRGQDRLKNALPGGGGSNRLMLGIVAAGLIGLWVLQSVYTVQPNELGVELVFGKPKQEVSGPGLHLAYWPIETVEITTIAERLVNIPDGGRTSKEGLMLSGDQNIVDVRFSVAYQIAQPGQYLFEVKEPDSMVRQVAESAMREIVGRRPAQDIFRDDRQGIAENVRQVIQTSLDEYGSGIAINAVSIEDAAPPAEVADAFDEVQRAEQDEDRFRDEANQYSNQKLGAARGEAAQVREDAAAYKNRVVQEAQGEAARFLSVYGAYKVAPEVTRKRIFLETMEGVLRQSDKIILDEQGSGQGVVPYLPLPEIQKRAGQAASGGQ